MNVNHCPVNNYCISFQNHKIYLVVEKMKWNLTFNMSFKKFNLYAVFFFIWLNQSHARVASFNKPSNRSLTSELRENIVNGYPSLARPFFVRVLSMAGLKLCGGSVIERRWVLTSATCVDQQLHAWISVEVGDFNRVDPASEKIAVLEKFIHPGFEPGKKPRKDIALIKLALPVSSHRVINLCELNREPGTPVTVAGMGSTNSTHIEYPEVMMEATFTQVQFEVAGLFHVDMCRPDNICTEPLGVHSSICLMDEGSPLYVTMCDSRVPLCLYGVASYFTSPDMADNAPMVCSGRSFFANIPYFYPWIGKTILDNS